MRSDFLVVGAGIVGLSCARVLARAGGRVLVVERRRVGAEASSAAAGILSAQAESEMDAPLFKLAVQARKHYAALVPPLEDETGMRVDYSSRGLLFVALSDADERFLEELAAQQRRNGQTAEELGPSDVRQAEPNLNPDVRRALFFPDDHRVDNVRLIRALAASAVAQGATLLTGRPVTGLVVESGRVAGLRAGSETLSAPVVVNATGAWAGLISNDPEPPPIEPVRGQVASFETAPALLHHVIFSRRGYLVPRGDGAVLAGSTMERAGFDKSVTAGGLRYVLTTAIEIAPPVEDMPLAGTWSGLRAGTPDGRPVIGPGALPGLFHAGGLFRHGILLGPLVGEAVAKVALGQPPDVDLTPFLPTRFAGTEA